jgi:hypothetical protein
VWKLNQNPSTMAPTAPKTTAKKKSKGIKRKNPAKKASTATRSLAPSYRSRASAQASSWVPTPASSQAPMPAGFFHNSSRAPTTITGTQSRHTSVSDEDDNTPSHIGGVLAHDDDAIMRDATDLGDTSDSIPIELEESEEEDAEAELSM